MIMSLNKNFYLLHYRLEINTSHCLNTYLALKDSPHSIDILSQSNKKFKKSIE